MGDSSHEVISVYFQNSLSLYVHDAKIHHDVYPQQGKSLKHKGENPIALITIQFCGKKFYQQICVKSGDSIQSIGRDMGWGDNPLLPT